MFKESNEYIFSFRFLEELNEDLIGNNLWEILRSNGPSKIFVSINDSADLDIFNSKYTLIGKGFNFDRIKDKTVHLIISSRGFVVYSPLIANILNKFKLCISLDKYDINKIYDDVIKYYCGKKKVCIFEENKFICLRINPLSNLSSKRNDYIKDNNNYIIKDISGEDIFIDDYFFYFYASGKFCAIKKDKVLLI